ncbi:sensor histidine kinase [Spirosoma soli]|uniref:histidine kinase n=1 Tax=Spirosoma soli TaxID=1770529 RepID=A0ABW5LX89_9BACT
MFRLFDQAYQVQHTSPDSAYALIVQAGAISRKNGFDQGLFNYYNQAMYNRAAYRSDFKLARRLSDTAMVLVEHPARQRFRMLMDFSRAIFHQLQEQNDSAIIYYLRALDNQQFTQDTSRVPMIQNNLAILFHFQQRDDLAIEYQLKSPQRAISDADTGSMIGNYVNLYGFETARKDTAAAFKYLAKGITLAAGPKTWREQTELYKNAGEYYVARHRTDSARYYFGRYYDLTRSLYPPAYLAQPLIGLAQADWLAGDWRATKRRLGEVARLTAVGSLPMLDRQNYYQTQYRLLKKTGRPAEALIALEQYNAAVSEFDNGKKNEQLIQYDNKVRKLREEKQNAERQLALTKKNNIIAALIAGCLVVALVATLLVLYWRKRKMLESEKLAKLELEAEWTQLKSRMAAQLEERSRISQELHDELGATLTSISLASELLKQNARTDSPEVRIIAKASSEMTIKMNEIVWSLNANNDTVQSLVAYVRKFCADFLDEAGIQMIFSESIIDPERELKGFIRRSVYHSVKEAVNNIVKHAEASKVELTIETIDNELAILIRDNGKGMPENAAKRWSNGLRNMKKNIETIRGQINWVTDNGTSVLIQTPMSL